MGNNEMILGEDMYYDLDTHKTKLNNNVLVVGASGTGKTRGMRYSFKDPLAGLKNTGDGDQ